MSVLQSLTLSEAAVKIRWLEQYVSAGINQKSLATNPKGVIAGFRVVPNSGMVVTVQMDPTLNLSIANILETSTGPFSLTVVQNSNVNIDLTAQQNSTVYIALDIQYVTTTPTTGQIKVVDAAELGSNLDLVVLAKINVPTTPGPVTSSNINMGYRLSAGDFTPPESYQALNLIGNSSFENNSINGWTNSGFDTAASSTDRAKTGTHSLKLTKGSSGTPSISTRFLFAIPARTYKVSAWFCAPVALTGGGAKLQVSWFDATGTIIGSAVDVESAFTGGTTTFVQVLTEVTAPSLAYYAQARVFYNTSSGTLYVDDVMFVDYFNNSLTEQIWGGALGINTNALANWADGTTNPASTVQAQFAKIVTDLDSQSGTGGAGKIGFTPTGNIASNRVDTALAELDTEKAGLGLNNVFTGNNTFNTGTSTFNNGIIVGGGNIAFSAITQTMAWTTISMREEAAHQLGIYDSATLYADLITDSGHDAAHLRLYGASMTGIISMDSTIPALQIRSDATTSTPIEFHTNNVKRWQVKGTGELASIGGPRAVQSVLDPVTAQDAATLHSQTLADNILPPQNYVLNSSMDFWQRGGLVPADVPLAAAPSYTFSADRWYAQIASGSGTNTANGIFFFLGAIPFNQIKRTSGVDTNVAKRSLVYELEYDQIPYLNSLNSSLSIPLTLQFAVLNGSGITGTLVAKMYQGTSGVYGSGYASQSTIFTSGSLLAGGTFQYAIPPTTFTGARVAIVFEWTPTANPAVANESFAIKDVMLVAGDRTSAGAIPAPNRVSPTIELEYLALARYYEKSYRYEDAPGTSTIVGEYTTVCGAIAVTNGNPFKMTHPRYRVTKNAGGTVKLWSVTGGANQWRVASVDGTTVGTTNTSAVGFEVTNASGGTITPATNSVEMTGHWEVSCEVGEF